MPEPDAEGLAQLQDMGFSAALAGKALLLSRNRPDAALEWALQHADDADAEAPPSPSELQAGEYKVFRVCNTPGSSRLAALHHITCSGAEALSFRPALQADEHRIL